MLTDERYVSRLKFALKTNHKRARMPERVVITFFNDHRHSLAVSKKTRIISIFELYKYIYIFIRYIL